MDSAGEGRGALYSRVFLLNGLTLHIRHIGFASSAILKVLQQTYTASVGSDSISCAVELVTYPSLIIHKSIMYKYYLDALEHNYDPENPRSWKTICQSCNVSRNVPVRLRCCFQLSYEVLLFLTCILSSGTAVIGSPLLWHPAY